MKAGHMGQIVIAIGEAVNCKMFPPRPIFVPFASQLNIFRHFESYLSLSLTLQGIQVFDPKDRGQGNKVKFVKKF